MGIHQKQRCWRRACGLRSILVRNICVILMLIAAILPSRALSFANSAAVHVPKQQGKAGCQHCACGGDSTCCLKQTAPNPEPAPIQTPVRVHHFDFLALVARSEVLFSKTDFYRITPHRDYAQIGNRRFIPAFIQNCSFVI